VGRKGWARLVQLNYTEQKGRIVFLVLVVLLLVMLLGATLSRPL
jgi:hypothetical protein